MPLKGSLDDAGVGALAKELQSLYEKGQDGRYYLQVEGMAPAERVAEFRENNITLKKELEKFQGIDPVKHADLVKREKAIMDGKLVDEGKVEELIKGRVEGMRTEHQKAVDELVKKSQTLEARLSSVLIDSAVKSAAVSLGVLPTAVDDVVLRAKAVFQIKDGEAVAVNDRGDVIYGADPTKPMGIDEWVKTLKTKAGHLFQGFKGGGSGGPGGPGGVDTSKLSATQKIAQGLSART